MGTLYIVATPIGNLEDISARALRVLGDVPVIAAEDTRHSRKLLNHFGITTPLISYHEHNQRQREEHLLARLAEGDVALITDAGTPAISDPGAGIVRAALAAGYAVSPIPGPSSLAAGVSVSGLIDGPFVMLGFLPREAAPRQRMVGRAGSTGWPLVLFESAQRLAATLQELAGALGDRDAVVLRELTKVHEEVRSGTLSDLASWADSGSVRGEIVLVIGGSEAAGGASADDAAEVVAALRRAGLSPSKAAREAAAITGLPRAELYALATRPLDEGSVRLEGELSLAQEDTLQQPLGDQEGPERGQARADEG
ncbi:MAG: 16S rRNA (cytidine(1402)-2'-O)-methyltransferase [Chloroflexota bacterium]|nr:16S rRNA (cytidine(1402)-2'-O)-methyltransferase [Chloroflexota bacterium]